MKLTLARQAAQALARSRLYAAEQTLRRADDVPRRGERAARFVARLQPHAARRSRSSASPASPTGARSTWSGRQGEIERLAVAHEDPEKVRWAYELQDRYPPDPDAPTGVPHVLRTGEPEFFPELPQELLDEAIGDDEELRRIIDELGLKSTICVPLVARGPDAGRADADRGGDAPAVHAGRPRSWRSSSRAAPRSPSTTPALPRGRARRQRGARARLRRRRRRSARHATAACATGTLPRLRSPASTRSDALGCLVAEVVPALGRAHLTRAAGAAGRRREAGHGPDRARRPRALGVGLGRRVRRRHRLRAAGRDRGARAREDAQRLRRHRLARAAHARSRPSTAPSARCGATMSS